MFSISFLSNAAALVLTKSAVLSLQGNDNSVKRSYFYLCLVHKHITDIKWCLCFLQADIIVLNCDVCCSFPLTDMLGKLAVCKSVYEFENGSDLVFCEIGHVSPIFYSRIYDAYTSAWLLRRFGGTYGRVVLEFAMFYILLHHCLCSLPCRGSQKSWGYGHAFS